MRIHERAATNAPLTINVAPSLQRGLFTRSSYILPKYMFLDLPQDVIRSVARFRLCAHTLRVETLTFNHNTSPTFDLCNADDTQDE